MFITGAKQFSAQLIYTDRLIGGVGYSMSWYLQLPLGTQRCCDIESTSLTLIYCLNNVVWPVGCIYFSLRKKSSEKLTPVFSISVSVSQYRLKVYNQRNTVCISPNIHFICFVLQEGCRISGWQKGHLYDRYYTRDQYGQNILPRALLLLYHSL